MINNIPTTIDEYILGCIPEIQPILHKLRNKILEAAPEASEKISWGMATFVYHGNLVHFSAEKNHIGFHPTPTAIEAFNLELSDYKCSKGTVRFPYDKEIPWDLIKNIVTFRVKEQDSIMESKKNGQKTEKVLRPRFQMPDDVAILLKTKCLTKEYDSRPPYQKNDYIGWIINAKRPETRKKRLEQMIDELRKGNVYMGKPYNIKKNI